MNKARVAYYFIGSIVLGLIIAGMDLLARQWSKPTARQIPMPHPVLILKEEFLEPLGMSIYALAEEIRVPRSRLDDICLGRHGITADIALRLGKYLNVDPQWFTNMQAKYDLHLRGAGC